LVPGDAVLRTIVARAATLVERLRQPATGHADEFSRARWKRWSRLLGGDDAVRARLQSIAVHETDAFFSLTDHAFAVELPMWAISLRDLLVTYQQPVDEADGPRPPVALSHGITAPFEQYAAGALGAQYSEALQHDLQQRLDEIAGRVARLEAQRHAARANALAIREISNTQARSFVADLLSGNLIALLAEYSVMARLLTVVTIQWIENVQQMLARIDRDAAALPGERGLAAGTVVGIHLGLSDAHNGGQSVARVLFSNGSQVVYKPKPIASERAYARLINWLNANGAPIAFRAPHVLEGDGYGWSEFIGTESCTDDQGVQRYFQRLGAIQAIAFVFGGTDLHVENVIAAGEWPVAVDTETFPYPHRRVWADASPDEPIEDSVLRTSVFPVWYPGVNGVSKAPLPSVAGVRSTLVPHLQAVKKGFAATYGFLASHREVLLSPDGPLSYFEAVPARYGHRATAVYDFLLKRLAYPKYLRCGIDRSMELEILARPCLSREHGGEGVPWSIFHEESRALEIMDVPCFHVQSNSRSLSVGGQGIAADTFTHTGLQSARERIRCLSTSNLALQVRCLEAAAHAASAPAVPPQAELSQHASVDLAEAAAEIGRDLVARALGNKATRWISLHRVSNAELMRVHVLGDNLYHGRVGIALFLAALDPAHADHVQRILESCYGPAFQEPRIGAASGIGGHLFALARLASLLGDDRHLDTACRLASELTPARIRDDVALDVTDGAAGALVGLLALHRAPGDATLLSRAECCGDHVLRQRVSTASGNRAWQTLGWPRPHTGLSHGAAGFAMALLRLSHVTGKPEYREAAIEAIAYERAMFNAERNNWPDFRGVTGESQQPTYQSTWCHGATGIGFARLATLDVLDTPEVRAEIDVALETTRQVSMNDADHLCCGNMGRVDLLLEAGLRLGRPALIADAQRAASGIVARARAARTFALYAGVPGDTFSLSFFHGISGIGYSLLRLAFPGRDPCVLNWGEVLPG